MTENVLWWVHLPSNWRIAKLKHIANFQLSNVDKLAVEGQQSVLLCNYVDVYKNEKIVANMPFMQASATDEQIKRLSIQKGDVLLLSVRAFLQRFKTFAVKTMKKRCNGKTIIQTTCIAL